MPESESWQPVADTLGFKDEREMLVNLYTIQEFSLSQLKGILGYSTWSIRRRLILNGIPPRSRGGPNSRLGKRRLKHLSSEELLGSAAEIALKHQVHISTVYAEVRFRTKEIRNAILQHHASECLSEARSKEQVPHGAGSALTH